MAVEDILPISDSEHWKEAQLERANLKLGIEHSDGEYHLGVGQRLAVTLVQLAGAPQIWEYDDSVDVLDPNILKPAEDFMIGASHLRLPPMPDERLEAIGLQCLLYEAISPGSTVISLKVVGGSQFSEPEPTFRATIIVSS